MGPSQGWGCAVGETDAHAAVEFALVSLDVPLPSPEAAAARGGLGRGWG